MIITKIFSYKITSEFFPYYTTQNLKIYKGNIFSYIHIHSDTNYLLLRKEQLNTED